jgi:hypothetical protein
MVGRKGKAGNEVRREKAKIVSSKKKNSRQ